MSDSERPAQAPERRDLHSWPEKWAQAILNVGSVSPERRVAVLQDIEIGSQPTPMYYILLGISELIAGFALLIGSDATLIGANVVAPLMTPIIGISLGLMRGDLRLLRVALIAEFGGAAFGVLLTFLLGLVPFAMDPTPLLLAQTQPTLIDLLVAALAGFAGVLAMIDERVSPALPGVAIATALNPPVAAIGLCLAFGAYEGAWGAFILFFANVLAILVVAAVLFVIAGFVRKTEMGPVRGLLRRFAPAAIGLVLVGALLTNYLLRTVGNIKTQRAITSVLDEALAQEPSTALVDVDFSREKGGVDVLSEVRTPHVIAPARVKEIQDALGERLGEPVRLFMRCALTKDVTATGSTTLRPYLSLDGKVATAPASPNMRRLQQAEQVAREVVATRPDIILKNTELVNFVTGPVIVVSIESSRALTPDRVARFEELLRQRLEDQTVRVVVRVAESIDITSKGRILFGEAHFSAATADEVARQREVEAAVRANLEGLPNTFVTAIDAVRRPDGWSVRAEIVSASIPAPIDIRKVEEGSAKKLDEPVQLSVRARTELLITGTDYRAISALRAPEADGEATDDSESR